MSTCGGAVVVVGNKFWRLWLLLFVDEVLEKRFRCVSLQLLEGIVLEVEIGEAKVTFFSFLVAAAAGVADAAAAAADVVGGAGLDATALDGLLRMLEGASLSLRYLASISSKKSSSLQIHLSSASVAAAWLMLLMLEGIVEKLMALINALTWLTMAWLDGISCPCSRLAMDHLNGCTCNVLVTFCRRLTDETIGLRSSPFGRERASATTLLLPSR